MDPEAYLWSVILQSGSSAKLRRRDTSDEVAARHTPGRSAPYPFLRRGNGPDPHAAVHEPPRVSNETCEGAPSPIAGSHALDSEQQPVERHWWRPFHDLLAMR
jgi:hypothetical protein